MSTNKFKSKICAIGRLIHSYRSSGRLLYVEDMVLFRDFLEILMTQEADGLYKSLGVTQRRVTEIAIQLIPSFSEFVASIGRLTVSLPLGKRFNQSILFIDTM